MLRSFMENLINFNAQSASQSWYVR